MTAEQMPEAARPTFEEGEWVNLRARIHRRNFEQALIEFRSMDGVFSIRVPVSELSTFRDEEEVEHD